MITPTSSAADSSSVQPLLDDTSLKGREVRDAVSQDRMRLGHQLPGVAGLLDALQGLFLMTHVCRANVEKTIEGPYGIY